ncbi:MAG: rubredoxin [Burkholderiales bacterium]|nr:rubredoxin [Burkholderiales bacterium]
MRAMRQEKGEPHEGYAPGTLWDAIPDSFCCPRCAVRDKADFEIVPVVS